MNKQYEQLIADYLAGETVDDLLIEACKNDAELLVYLSENLAFNRIVAFAAHAKSDEVFNSEMAKRLENIELNTERFVTPNNSNNLNKNNANSSIKPLALASEKAQNQPKKSTWQPLFALCASLVVAVLIGFNTFSEKHIAIVNKVVGAKHQQTLLNEGFLINAGKFSLSQGYAEITLNNGVMLLLEAPIELSIKNVEHISLLNGNLVARVPEQAIGFKIDTPSSEIVDLGTEFGVSVDIKGKSQVHVLTGEVKVRSSDKEEYEHLIENQARAFDLTSQVAIIKSNPSLFMRTLPGKTIEKPEYLHWSFDQQTGTKLTCDGNGIAGKCYNANVKSLLKTPTKLSFTTGKFADALYFNGIDTWLETDFSGIGGNKPRTVAFWMKTPPKFDPQFSFGILSWGLSDKFSAWQISPNPQESLGPLGRIRIGTNHAEVIGTTDITDNNWHHVAIVLFGGEHADLSTHILIYIDGKLEKTSKKSIAKVFTELNHPKSKPLTMGKNIAFNNPKNTKQHYRFFKGWLDEVYIFDSALNEKQISRLITSNTVNK